VSVQAQLEANDIPEFANEPGPGHYYGPDIKGFSDFGDPKFEKCESSPDIVMYSDFGGVYFARTGWDGMKKVIISKGHEGAYKLRDSPGPVYWDRSHWVDSPCKGYDDYSSLNEGRKNFLDLERSGSFAKSQRPDLSVSLGMNPKGSPGPSEYNIRDCKAGAGLQIVDPKTSKGSISKAERFETRASKGPGPYSRKDVALNPSTGRSFGAPRSCYEKVIRPGWEKDGQCKTSSKIGEIDVNVDLTKEGLGATRHFQAANGQLSNGQGEKIYGGGMSQRFPRNREAAAIPGPGQYKMQDRWHQQFGQKKELDKDPNKDANAAKPPGTFGRVPRKPRFRQVLALTTAQRGGWGYF
jgi:hypothetical protein